MKPALTAEEWAYLLCERIYAASVHLTNDPEANPTQTHEMCFTNRHQAAAAALHNQPFGFTREDVDLLHEIAGNELGCTDDDTLWKPMFDLATRIEALLPPEEVK